MDPTSLITLISTFCLTFPALRPAYHDYKRCLIKAHRMKNQLNFLKACRREKVIPKSFLPRRLRNFSQQPYSELDDLLLNEYIKKSNIDGKIAFQRARSASDKLKNSVTVYWWNVICDFVYTKLRNIRRTHKEQLQVKLERLFRESFWCTKSNPELYINLSSYELNENEKLALGFGLNFSIANGPANFVCC